MGRLGKILYPTILCIAAYLAGCDSGGNVLAGIDRGGLRGVYGSISGFGSVIVNGVHYETTSAAISIDGMSGAESDLEVGFVVAIQADLSGNGTSPQALTIDFNHLVIGPLTAVFAAENRATVLGQNVTLADTTAYGSGIVPPSVDGLASLPQGTILRVSGFTGADGNILATRLDIGDPGSGYEVTGVVANRDSAEQTFEIGRLLVRTDSATVLNFPSGEPQNGDRVKVQGNILDAGGALVATELEFQNLQLELDKDHELEIEGLITTIDTTMSFPQFLLSGITVSTDATTTYEHGDASMLALNRRVEVEGQLDNNGILKADKIEFSQEGPLRIEAVVESVDPVLKMLGITVQADELTIFEDDSSVELQYFSQADILPGDSLRVVGYESPTTPGIVVATSITRTETLDKFRLRGIAENVMAPDLTVLGVPVSTNGSTDIEADFFTVAEGRLVEVTGSTSSGSFVAEKIELID